MAMLFELKRTRPGVLDSVAHAMQRSDTRIAAPRELERFREPHADDLVVDDIRRHPDERQVGFALANELVPCGIGNEVCETLQRDGVSIMDVFGDCGLQ